jgi:hypothetical protein
MKSLIPTLFLVALLSSSRLSGQARPRPPGLQQAEQAEAQMERNVPPPSVHHPAPDTAKLEHEADELARVTQSIPPDIKSVGKGLFPKDVIQRLKQIEKLSKHLRGELTR